ncbi:MAG: hypothetical protein H7062_07470 [Candidatus Saccharimonas sp.]|nr:hypothetical protein [Planctomycetaceae bacterium]
MTNDTHPTSLNKDEVFLGVVESLQCAIGDSEVLEPTTNLIEYLRRTGAWDDVDMADLMYCIGQEFGLSFSNEEGMEFFNPSIGGQRRTDEAWEQEVAPKLTVAALTDFVRERYVPVSFEPVSVLGSPRCPAAGYFVGMSELVQQVRPDAERFGPSTPITQVLPSHSLSVFWRRLGRAAGRSLPELSFWLNHLANALLVASAACLVFGVFVNGAFLAAVWLLCLKGIQFGWWLHRRANPLPQGIVTFGDLARHLAGQKEIPAPRSLSRRAGAWVGRTFLRHRSAETPMERTP